MARLYSSGFEVNNLASGWEWNTVAGAVSLSSAVKRSGSYSLRVNPSSGTGSVYVGFLASAGANHYFRFYLRIASAPSANTRIAMFSSGGSQQAGILLKTDRTLQGVGQSDANTIGSPSSALTLDTWYMIEFWVSNPGASTGSSDFKLNGSTWASHTNTTPDIDTGDRFDIGALTSTTCDIYFDDVAINDTAGTVQNSWPGEGAIAALWPNSDSSLGWATIFPTTPTTHYDKIKADSLDDASSYIEDTTLNNLDVLTLDDFTPSADSITLVETHVRWRDVGLSSGVLYAGLSDGTLTNNGQSLDTSSSNTWVTDEDHAQYTTVDYRPGLTIYKQLDGSTALNQTYLNSLLLRILNGDGDTYQVTAAWVNVEYVPGAGEIIQKSLGYMIKRTPSALTKTLRYEMVTPVIPHHIDLVQASWSSTSTSFSNIYGYYLHESANFDGSLKAYFQATINTSNGSYACSVRLYDVTAGAAVPNTTLSTTSTTFAQGQSTTDIADYLIDGHVYLVQIMTANAIATARCMGARIVLRHKTLKQPTAITNFQPVAVASSVTGAGSDSYTTPSLSPIIRTDVAQYDGTLNTYFEATLYTSGSTGSDITYARLWDVTSSAAVSGSEVSIVGSSGNVQRVRSSAITLIDGHEYQVQIKQAVTGDTAYVYSAHIVYKQTGTIKKTQLHELVNSIEGSTTSTTFSYFYAGVLFNDAMFANYDTLAAYFEANIKTNNASGVATSNLYDLTNTTTLSGDISTSSLTYVRQRSTSFDIVSLAGNLDDLKQQLKTNNASYTSYILASRIIINVQLISAVSYSITKSLKYVTNQKVIKLTDNFDDNSFDTNKWNKFSYTNVNEQNQQLEMRVNADDAEEAEFVSVLLFDLRDSQLHFKASFGTQSAVYQTTFYLQNESISGNVDSVSFQVTNGTLYARKRVSGSTTDVASTAYNATNHKYLRFREASGTLYWDYSSDAVNWNNLGSSANNAQLKSVRWYAYAGNNASGDKITAIDNISLTPIAITKSLQYSVKKSNAITKSQIYTIRHSLSLTKQLIYRIKTIPSALTKQLIYRIKKAYSVTKSLQYVIKRTPSALTKQLIYRIKTTPTVITKSLQYTIEHPVAVTKQLIYRIRTIPSAMTKSLQYAIKKSTAITKSLSYEILTAQTYTITKSLQYAIERVVAITKSLQYTIKSTPAALTKSLKYTVKTTPTAISKSLQYFIRRVTAITKSLQYTVKTTPSAMTKSLAYYVRRVTAITKSLQYTIKYGVPITKALQYTIKRSVALTKSLQYTIERTPMALTKILQYAIKRVPIITKQLKYTLKTTPSALTKQLKYVIFLGVFSITKSLQYTIKRSTAITKSLAYTVKTSPAITKQLVYRMAGQGAILTKSLTYAIKNPYSVTKSLAYAIRRPPSALTKSLQYTIKKGVAITKSLKYTLLTTPTALTKQLKYLVRLTPAATQKQLHYAVIRPTALQKNMIYGIRISQTVVIVKQLKYTVKASAPHLTRQLTYHIIVNGYVNLYVPQNTLYNEKYNPQSTGYGEKYVAQGTGYNEKYNPQSTGYNELYVPQGTTYAEKYP